jgi:hypothetical protein
MISFMISVVPGSTDRQDQPSQSVTLSGEPRQSCGGWEIVSAAGGVSIGPGLSISDKRLSMENLFELVAPRDDVLSGELTEGKIAGRGTGVAELMALVAAALLGSAERLEYTLVGDTVNLSQRLQQLAAAGETVISEATARALIVPARLTPLPSQRVKGHDTPVVAYRIKGPPGQETAAAVLSGRPGRLRPGSRPRRVRVPRPRPRRRGNSRVPRPARRRASRPGGQTPCTRRIRESGRRPHTARAHR